MKNLSFIGATLAIIGFGLLPVNAVEKGTNNNTNFTDATEQIKQSTQPQQTCPRPYIYVPGYGCV